MASGHHEDRRRGPRPRSTLSAASPEQLRLDQLNAERAGAGAGAGGTNPPKRVVTAEDWESSDDGRNPGLFYVSAGRASDNIGQVRVNLRDKGIAEQIVAQRLVPEYRTPADFIRDAIHHRLLELQEMGVLEGELIAEVRLAEVEYRLMAMAERQRQVESIMGLTRELFSTNQGNPEVLLNLSARLLEMAPHTDQQRQGELVALVDDITHAIERVSAVRQLRPMADTA